MRYLLAPRNRPVLKKFANSRTLVAFDFDGTLAPIVNHRNRAALRPPTRRALAELATLYPCIVISGRARKDVQSRLRGIALQAVVGNHGIEPWSATPAMERAVQRWLPLLRERLRPFSGVFVESKRFTVAIHYRHESRKQAVCAAIDAVIRTLGAVRVIGGKQVVNILAADAPHKGLALKRAAVQLACNKAIYFGDDDTDEDAFVTAGPRRLLSIRVGINRDSLARFYLRSQREIDRAIHSLIQMRAN